MASPALNPASIPFFPSGTGTTDGTDQASVGMGLGFKLSTGTHSKEISLTSNLSASSAEYRSATSSPSLSTSVTGSVDDSHVQTVSATGSTIQHAKENGLQNESANRDAHATITDLIHGDELDNDNFEKLSGGETPGPRAIHQWVMGAQTPSPAKSGSDGIEFSTSLNNALHDHHSPHSMPTRTSTNSTTPSFNIPFKSTSPVSSVGSASINTPSVDYSTVNFEAQIRASPTIRDLIDRLARCEFSNRELQRELAEVHNKVNLLVERAIGPVNAEPEFKNPFASAPASSRSLTPAMLSQTSSQQSSPTKSDELTQLSQRINTLTSSVGQLLALQTQQHMNSVAQVFNQAPGHMPAQPSLDIAPNQIISSTPPVSQAALLGHGLPNRPDLRPSPRTPNPPMRTWSAGTLELPMRPTESLLSRPDGSLRDKRKSVTGLLRRDSSGVRKAKQ